MQHPDAVPHIFSQRSSLEVILRAADGLQAESGDLDYSLHQAGKGW